MKLQLILYISLVVWPFCSCAPTLHMTSPGFPVLFAFGLTSCSFVPMFPVEVHVPTSLTDFLERISLLNRVSVVWLFVFWK